MTAMWTGSHSKIQISLVAALASALIVGVGAVSRAGPTSTPTATPTPTTSPPPLCDNYCYLDKKCSVGGSEPQESCVASPGEEVTYHYFVEAGVGGLPVYVQVVDDKLGFIGTNTEQAQEFIRTTTLTETTTNTASMTARDSCPCPGEPITDSVTVAVSPCTSANPLTSIVTIAKGQSPTNNPKLSHTITGYIVDAGSLGPTAHRIEVCAGTSITALVTDTSGRPTNTAAGSLACGSTKCSGVVNVSEKYQSISQDGRDKDSITFIPK